MGTDDGKFWLGVWAIIATAVVILVITASINNYEVKKLWIENGYEQIMEIGNEQYIWRKVK